MNEHEQEPVAVQEDGYKTIEEFVGDHEHGEVIGVCKWFNKKFGYGFITACEGEHKGITVFVHHSGIKPLNSHFRTLRKGEYVHFDTETGKNGLQAVHVTGVLGGPLMCDNLVHNKENMFYPHSSQNKSDHKPK